MVPCLPSRVLTSRPMLGIGYIRGIKEVPSARTSGPCNYAKIAPDRISDEPLSRGGCWCFTRGRGGREFRGLWVIGVEEGLGERSCGELRSCS